jgi:two-component system phosphate regulon sensor histidine kinase PhoR
LVKKLFPTRKQVPEGEVRGMSVDAARGRLLVEESREIVAVLDEERRVLSASRRARDSIPGLVEGEPLPPTAVDGGRGKPVEVVYELDGRTETLLYLGRPGDLAAYEELRAGFTAAVSHELRTPLARLLALLETALLPGSDQTALIEQARSEVEEIRELIDDVLFLSELETGRQVVALGSTLARPVLEEVAAALSRRAERAGVRIEVEGPEDLAVPLRPRMLRVIVENLAANAIRYAGSGATLRLSLRRDADAVTLAADDDGAGVEESDLPRLFERFYRADRARASRGTGLGLAIVKHIVTSAGGSVDAAGAPGRGLQIRCRFPD